MENRRIEVRASRNIKGIHEESQLGVGLAVDINDDESLDESFQKLLEEVSKQLNETNLVKVFG